MMQTHTHTHTVKTQERQQWHWYLTSAGLPSSTLTPSILKCKKNNHGLLRKGEKSQGHWLCSCPVKGLCRDLNPGNVLSAQHCAPHKIQNLCPHAETEHKHEASSAKLQAQLQIITMAWQNHNKNSHINLFGFPVCIKSCIYTILSSSKCVIALCPESHAVP